MSSRGMHTSRGDLPRLYQGDCFAKIRLAMTFLVCNYLFNKAPEVFLENNDLMLANFKPTDIENDEERIRGGTVLVYNKRTIK